jgi:hypothetical protein
LLKDKKDKKDKKYIKHIDINLIKIVGVQNEKTHCNPIYRIVD